MTAIHQPRLQLRPRDGNERIKLKTVGDDQFRNVGGRVVLGILASDILLKLNFISVTSVFTSEMTLTYFLEISILLKRLIMMDYVL